MAIIGDAAHVMSLFAGEGVNFALAVAADLAPEILSEQPNTIERFERRWMWFRSEHAAIESAANLEMFFGGGGAPAVAEMYKDMFGVWNLGNIAIEWFRFKFRSACWRWY